VGSGGGGWWEGGGGSLINSYGDGGGGGCHWQRDPTVPTHIIQYSRPHIYICSVHLLL
jgi:hypothetical protein